MYRYFCKLMVSGKGSVKTALNLGQHFCEGRTYLLYLAILSFPDPLQSQVSIPQLA